MPSTAIDVAVGIVLICYGAYAIYVGEIRGKFRSYSRSEEPGSFWASVVITFVLALVFFIAAPHWRH